MSEVKNIYQRINAVMKDVEYVQKDKAVSGGGANYKAVTHDQVISAVRASMVEHGVVIEPVQVSGSFLVMRDLNATPQPIKMGLYAGEYEVYFVNMDIPDQKTCIKVQAHANDNGDKAPGKALTYATKAAILKQFSLETGENDESRQEEKDISMISEEQAVSVEALMVEKGPEGTVWTQQAQKCLQKYRLGNVRQLKSSKLEAFKKDLGA